MVVFAIPILAHMPWFTDPKDTEQLIMIRNCIWFVLEPLMLHKETYAFGFFKEVIEKLMHHVDATEPENEMANLVSFMSVLTDVFL